MPRREHGSTWRAAGRPFALSCGQLAWARTAGLGQAGCGRYRWNRGCSSRPPGTADNPQTSSALAPGSGPFPLGGNLSQTGCRRVRVGLHSACGCCRCQPPPTERRPRALAPRGATRERLRDTGRPCGLSGAHGRAAACAAAAMTRASLLATTLEANALLALVLADPLRFWKCYFECRLMLSRPPACPPS